MSNPAFCIGGHVGMPATDGKCANCRPAPRSRETQPQAPLCTNCGQHPQTHIYRVRPGGYARICAGCAASIPGSEPIAGYGPAQPQEPAASSVPCPTCGTEDSHCDCAQRISCEKAGDIGHWNCGVCPEHSTPRFICGCHAPAPTPTREADAAPAQEPPHDRYHAEMERVCPTCEHWRIRVCEGCNEQPESAPAPEPTCQHGKSAWCNECDLESRVAVLGAKLERARAENRPLRERITQLEAALAEARDEVSTRDQRYAAAELCHEAQINECVADRDAARAYAAEEIRRRSIYADEFNKAVASLGDMQAKLDAALARAEQWESAFDELMVGGTAVAAERDQLRADLEAARAAMRADEERLRAAEHRVYGDDTTFGCDGADHLADLVLDGRAALRDAEAARDVALLEAERRTAMRDEMLEQGKAHWMAEAQRMLNELEAARAALRAQTEEAFEAGWDASRKVMLALPEWHMGQPPLPGCEEAYDAWQQTQALGNVSAPLTGSGPQTQAQEPTP